MNVGSEKFPEITNAEIETTLEQMRNGRAPGEMPVGGAITLDAINILINECLQNDAVPDIVVQWDFAVGSNFNSAFCIGIAI